MGNVLAVISKEVRSYFGSPIAYVMIAVYLFCCGFLFRNFVLAFHQQSLTFQPQFAGAQPVNANDLVITPFFGIRYFIWVVVVPMLTMRLYAEEKKSGTIELLMTSPITTWQTLLGKFAACLSLYIVMEAIGFLLLVLLSGYCEIDWGPVASGYLATFLLGAALISFGVLASSVTDNQIIAAVLSFFGLLLLWMVGLSSQFVKPGLARIIDAVSLPARMHDMNRGVIDTSDVLFFVSLAVFFLYVTNTVVESRRWRQ
jgi:ABC-2 type transport system permease protein